MSLSKTGKLREGRGLDDAFEVVLNAPVVACGILRVVAAEASGLIAVRQGRWIVGARLTGAGSDLHGNDALERLRNLRRGIYVYTQCLDVEEFARLDEEMTHDMVVLLSSAPVNAPLPGSPAVAAPSATPTPAAPAASAPAPPLNPPQDAPAQADRAPAAYQSPPLPADLEFAAAPPEYIREEPPTPEPEPPAPTLQDYLFGSAQAPSASPPTQSVSSGYAFEPSLPRGAESTPAPTSIAEKIVGSTRKTLLKLQSLDRVLTRQATEGTSSSAAIPAITPPAASAAGHAAPLPAQPFVQPPMAGNGAKASTSSFNLISDVRQTAWKIMSRALQQQRMEEKEERYQGAARLRSVEIAANEEGRAEKPKTWLQRIDGASIGGGALVVLAIAVIAGIMIFAQQWSPEKNYLRAAERYMKQKNYSQAIEQYSLAIQTSPNNDSTIRLRAQAYEQSEQFKQAAADYEQLLSRQPNNRDLILAAALDYFRAGDLSKVEEFCRKLPAKDAPVADALRCMADAKAGNAARALLHWPETNPSMPAALVPEFIAAHAGAYKACDQYADAINAYTQALALLPKEPRFLTDRGECYFRKDDFKAAAADFERAGEALPTDSHLLCDLGDAYTGMQRYEEAVKVYQYALHYTRPRPDVLLKIADCQMHLHRFGDAVATCDEALAIAPNNAQIDKTKQLALARAHQQKAIVTVQNVREVVRSELPQNVTYAQAGAMAYNSRNMSDATRFLMAATKDNPNDTTSRALLGQAFMAQGNARAAYQEFLCLEQQKALPPSATLAYADAAVATGESGKAMELFQLCLRSNPKWKEARLDYIQLCKSLGYSRKALSLAEEGAAYAHSAAEREEYLQACK